MENKKPVVAIFMYSMAGGGAERVVSYLLPFLKNHGVDLVLVLMNKTIQYDLPKDIRIAYLEKSKANEHGILKILKLPVLAYKYGRLLKRLHITHSLSMLTRPCYVNVMARWFTKHQFELIISERNYPSLLYGYGDLQSKINKRLIKWLYPKADKVITNARASAEDLIQNFDVDEGKTRVIYNPMDLDKISGIQPLSDFFDPAYFNTVSVGRLQTQKNQKVLIEAVEPFQKVRLYILGEGELRKELEATIKEKGLENRVFLLGFDANPYKYLKSADLFIFGSNHEGFPNVLLEAMACGLPILTTNCKSGPDEIMELQVEKHDDIMITPYGILAPVGHVEALRKGLAHFQENTDYHNTCRTNVLRRAGDFEKDRILETYMEEILA